MPDSTFSGAVTQRDANLNGQVLPAPTSYYDGVAMMAVFPARLNMLRAVLPDPSLVPAQLAPGVGVVGVSCFEYHDSDIGPHNQLPISIVLNQPYFCANLPGRALVSGLRQRQLDTWVQHLPVTTETARTAGVDYYHHPTFLASIECTADPGRRSCRVAEGSEHILTLSAPTIPTARAAGLQLFSHLWIDGRPRTSEFKVNAHAMGESLSPGAATLTLGDRHPIARELAGMLLQRQSLCYQHLGWFQGILYERASGGVAVVPSGCATLRSGTRSARVSGPATRRRQPVG